MKEAASEFLAHRRIAVTGVSRKARDRGYLRSIPGGVDTVVTATSPDKAEGTMRECVEQRRSVRRAAVASGRALRAVTQRVAGSPTTMRTV